MRLHVPAVVLLALAACAPTATVEPVAPTAPSAAAVAPGLDVNATATCVRENATEGELALMAIGSDATASAAAKTQAQTVTATVLQRPATLACLQAAGVQLPGLPAS
jgi:type IV secretory pathway TrbL component